MPSVLRPSRLSAFALLTVLALGGCWFGKKGEVVYFDCDDTVLRTETYDDETMDIYHGQKNFTLTQTEAASGARYSTAEGKSPEIMFWNKGRRALFKVDGKVFPTCKISTPGRYRAHGAEPFWQATVQNNTLTLTSSKDGTRQRLAVQSTEQKGSTTVLTAGKDDRKVVISVKRDGCKDKETQMPYPDTVTLTMDGKDIKGCGGY